MAWEKEAISWMFASGGFKLQFEIWQNFINRGLENIFFWSDIISFSAHEVLLKHDYSTNIRYYHLLHKLLKSIFCCIFVFFITDSTLPRASISIFFCNWIDNGRGNGEMCFTKAKPIINSVFFLSQSWKC